jgi:hypothetical protein
MAPQSSASSNDSRKYRRSWKNLLINKQVQLRFTLFMVGLSAALMMLLGIWVKRVADNTTEVGLARVRGEPCPPLPEVAAAATGAVAPKVDATATAASVVGDPTVPAEMVEPKGPALADGAEPPRARVLIDETSMTLTPTVPADLNDRVLAHWECELRQAGLIQDLEQRRRNIVWVLLASGLLLCSGLAIYGIKMTHRVAGPLHKVGLYFAQMREGRYGPVYPLRKGDELMAFYEHFKAAHAGVVAAETADVTRLRAMLEASGRGPQTPERTKALADMQVMIERKEKSFE